MARTCASARSWRGRTAPLTRSSSSSSRRRAGRTCGGRREPRPSRARCCCSTTPRDVKPASTNSRRTRRPAARFERSIATADFAAVPGAPAPDIVIPPLLQAISGKVCFTSNPLNEVSPFRDCLSYGAYTGDTGNNLRSGVSIAAGAPAATLPITSTVSLRRAVDTGRNADFTATTTPTPANIAGATFTLPVDSQIVQGERLFTQETFGGNGLYLRDVSRAKPELRPPARRRADAIRHGREHVRRAVRGRNGAVRVRRGVRLQPEHPDVDRRRRHGSAVHRRAARRDHGRVERRSRQGDRAIVIDVVPDRRRHLADARRDGQRRNVRRDGGECDARHRSARSPIRPCRVWKIRRLMRTTRADANSLSVRPRPVPREHRSAHAGQHRARGRPARVPEVAAPAEPALQRAVRFQRRHWRPAHVLDRRGPAALPPDAGAKRQWRVTRFPPADRRRTRRARGVSAGAGLPVRDRSRQVQPRPVRHVDGGDSRARRVLRRRRQVLALSRRVGVVPDDHHDLRLRRRQQRPVRYRRREPAIQRRHQSRRPAVRAQPHQRWRLRLAPVQRAPAVQRQTSDAALPRRFRV